MKDTKEITIADLLSDIKANPHMLQFYAKKNCRHCQGRGINITNVPIGGGKWADQKLMCPCVIKAVKKIAGAKTCQ